MQKIKVLAALALAAILTCTGCTTIPAGGGDPVYDATKTEQVKAAIKPLVVSGVRRAIQAETNAIPYLQTVSEVFSDARDRGEISPSVVARTLDSHLGALPIEKEWAMIVLDVKNAVLALYEIFYAERHTLQMPEDKWMYHVADVIATSFEQAIREAQPEGP